MVKWRPSLSRTFWPTSQTTKKWCVRWWCDVRELTDQVEIDLHDVTCCIYELLILTFHPQRDCWPHRTIVLKESNGSDSYNVLSMAEAIKGGQKQRDFGIILTSIWIKRKTVRNLWGIHHLYTSRRCPRGKRSNGHQADVSRVGAFLVFKRKSRLSSPPTKIGNREPLI